jgi:hypothetical protein
VLFSQDRVADFINQSFEPTWESVRPVPIVRIDFGNGNVLTRTLHGNILTSVCTPDGLTVDALPGIYTQTAYLDRLKDILQGAKSVGSHPAKTRDAVVHAYHRSRAMALKKKPRAAAAAADFTKTVKIEAPVLNVVQSKNSASATAEAPPNVDNPAEWKALEEDTRLNETVRRRQIHELLAATGLVRPDKLTRPIYKDVLHADLDDPYLGLGESLFANYPFAKEDAAH